MEQRRLRLGDILDDYCPRERRVTNHAVVAMIEDDVKQTRCTTCDAEHPYKGAREPRRRKKDATAVLYAEVLAGMPDAAEGGHTAATSDAATPALAAAPSNGNGDSHAPADHAADDSDDGQPVAAAGEPAGEGEGEGENDQVDDEAREDQSEPQAVDDGPIHRRLIRATLPRPEGQKNERPLPDFTIRTNGNHFRGDRMKTRGPGGAGNANGSQRGGRRFRGPSASGGGRPGFGGNRGPSTGSGRGRKRGR